MMTASGAERREDLLRLLRDRREAVTGTELAHRLNVSRQIVVQDIALLRAAGEPVLATARGYMYLASVPAAHRAILATRHSREGTREELSLMVDFGARVLDVIVEHRLYGELRAPLMITSRADIDAFVSHLEETGSALLSDLTGGVHLHTVEFPTTERLRQAREALACRGYLLRDEEIPLPASAH